MKLTAFQSDKGDCLLLETSNGKHRMLVDGGMRRAYTEHVASAMGALRKARKNLDIVYVSHIDSDHISGVLKLLDDEASWRVHEHQLANGNTTHEPPEGPRPPKVGAIFHNSFHDQLGSNSGDVEDMLAATAVTLSSGDVAGDVGLSEIALERHEIATSVAEALKVSQRIKAGQLNIPLNPHDAGKLMMVRPNLSPIRLGTIALHIIGPFSEDVTKLRKEWNTWLREHKDMVKKIRAQAKADSDDMGLSVTALLAPMASAAAALRAEELALAKRLGLRAKVTTPNLASLMFLAEDKNQTVLLTGDGHGDDILKGLEHHNRLDAAGKIHVDLLKVQHHGSEHNIDAGFCNRVTADHYLFCGNGEHENPELDVLQVIFDRRLANDTKKFKFWFNSTSTLSANAHGKTHMKAVEALVKRLKAKSKGRLSATFISGSSMRVL